MSEHEVSDEAYQSDEVIQSIEPADVDFRTYNNAQFCQNKQNLSAPTRELYDTLCLARCHEIPTRFIESDKYIERIDELVSVHLVYVQYFPKRHPKDRYYTYPILRKWNLDLLHSSHKNLQDSFRYACIFYVDELVYRNPCSTETEFDILCHVVKLAALYDQSKEALEVCEGFEFLLDECAKVLGASGKEDVAKGLQRVARKARGEKTTVCPKDVMGDDGVLEEDSR